MSLSPSLTLAELVSQRDIEDLVLSPRGVAAYRAGTWTGPTPIEESAPAALQNIARQIAELASQTLGLTQPSVDAYVRLGPDLFRAHVVVAPLVLEGPEITLRRLPTIDRFDLADFEATAAVRAELTAAVRAGKSLLIAGVTGSGKTSLLTALLRLVPDTDRVLVLEDSPEIPLPNGLSTKLLSRSNRFGFRAGATWELSHLVFESLRMRPDRLVLGECRGPEAGAIETAIMTGHSGIMTTIHAASPELALERFRQLASSQGSHGSVRCLWDLAVHLETRTDGRRAITGLWRAPLPAVSPA